jgi:prepilin-type N-terminal cleavage/methylation domain-containing protein
VNENSNHSNPPVLSSHRIKKKGKNVSMKMTSRKAGFTLVEIMIVVAIIGLLAAIAIPNFVKARQTSQTNACINNLRQIDAAEQQWALEFGKTTGDACTAADIQGYLGRSGTGVDVHCPLVAAGASLAGYTVNAVGTSPQCAQNAATHPAVLQ